MKARRCSLCHKAGHNRRKCHIRWARLRASELAKCAKLWAARGEKMPSQIVMGIVQEVVEALDRAILRGEVRK